jgi:hypothetical protein
MAVARKGKQRTPVPAESSEPGDLGSDPTGGATVAVLSVEEYLKLLASGGPGESLEERLEEVVSQRRPQPADRELTDAEKALEHLQAALESLDPGKVRH